MADTKITSLQPPQVGYPVVPATDVLPIVVIADPGMATSGSTRKVTVNQILGSGGTATLASATISGDLTVDTSTLKVDSTNNRVGILTATPTEPLTINNTGGIGTTGALRVFANDQSQARISIQNTNGQAYHWVAGFPGASNAGFGLYDNTAALTRWYVDNTGVHTWWNVGGVAGTAMTLNSTGLLVGTVNNFASSRLCVQGTAGTSTPDVTIGIPVNSSGNTGLAIGRSASTNGYIFLDAYKAAVGGTELVLNSINGGSVLIGLSTVVAAGGCLQLKSGITFPATQVASSDANTLDDYEEGTFTPTIIGTTTSGAGVYVDQSGLYTKVGRQVTIQIFLNWTAHTGTGNMRLTGLPFTSSNSFQSASVGYWNNIAITASNTPMAYVVPSATSIELLQMPSGGGAMGPIPIDVSGGLMISATYFV